MTKQGPITRLALNRPDKLNAQTPAMWRHLAFELGPELLADTETRVLILEGIGRCFSSGDEFGRLTNPASGEVAGARFVVWLPVPK